VKSDVQKRVATRSGRRLPPEPRTVSLRMVRCYNAGLSIQFCDVVRPSTRAAKAPFHSRNILFGNRAFSELLAQMTGRVRRPCKNHDARGRAIQSMDESHKRIFCTRVISDVPPGEREHALITRVVGLRQHARWFAHDKNMIVNVQHVHRRKA